MEAPDPGERPEPEFEHARPVDADERRVACQPAREFLAEALCIFPVASEPRGTSEHQPVLMAVLFPDDLVIAKARVEIRNRRPELTRRSATMDWIEMPVDLPRGRSRYVLIAEELAFPLQQTIAEAARFVGRTGKLLQDGFRSPLPPSRIDREQSLPCRKMLAQQLAGTTPVAIAERSPATSEVELRDRDKRDLSRSRFHPPELAAASILSATVRTRSRLRNQSSPGPILVMLRRTLVKTPAQLDSNDGSAAAT